MQKPSKPLYLLAFQLSVFKFSNFISLNIKIFLFVPKNQNYPHLSRFCQKLLTFEILMNYILFIKSN